MTTKKIELPGMLSFERKLEPSDALMFAGLWEDKEAVNGEKIKITKRQNRSTQSAHGTSDEDKKKPNPASSDSDDANLPLGKDTLKVSFSLRIVGNLGKPFGCDSPEFEAIIKDKVADFKNSEGINVLAERYAYNIANGRFLWRNRVGAEEVAIHVKIEETDFSFNAYDFSLNDFNKNKDNNELVKLAEKIKIGLLGDIESFVLINVNAYVKLGELQHVFPSQEMNVGKKGKVLFKLDDCAAIHNVKIGNAIRTIDTWYLRYNDIKQPIAIEPFGSVTQRGEAYRKDSKEGDFYSLMIDWVNDKELNQEQQVYVVGNLIRGGVFSKKSNK